MRANVCVMYSVRLRPRPGGLLHEEWGISVHARLPTHARHPLQWLRGLRRGRSCHRPGKDLPSCLLRLHHLQVRRLLSHAFANVMWLLEKFQTDSCPAWITLCSDWIAVMNQDEADRNSWWQRTGACHVSLLYVVWLLSSSGAQC